MFTLVPFYLDGRDPHLCPGLPAGSPSAFPATFFGAFCLRIKEISRVHRSSLHTPGLPVQPGPSPQAEPHMPEARAQLQPASHNYPACGAAERLHYMGPLSLQPARERLYRRLEGLGAPRGCRNFLGSQAREYHSLHPTPPPQVGQQLLPGHCIKVMAVFLGYIS